MKPIKILTGLFGILIPSLTMLGDTPGSTSGGLNGGPVPINPKPKPTIPDRPKAPSAQVVEASYEDGCLQLNFKYGEGPAVLYVYDADQTTLRSQHVFSSDSEASVYIGAVADAYILIETSGGHEYEGWIY